LRSRNGFSSSLASIGIAAALIFMLSVPESVASPFSGMGGAWAGAGRVTMRDGTSEPIKCKATYKVGNSGTELNQVLRCASDSYKFNVRSDIEADGNTLTGGWTETTYNLVGTFTGKSKGAKIEGKVRGSGLLVGVALLTNGSSQRVRILSQGTEMREVNLNLKKR